MKKQNSKIKKSLKKYATGTPVQNYIEDPYTELQQNQINLVKSQVEANSNPFINGLQALGNIGMQTGISMGGFGPSTVGKIGNKLLPILGNAQFAMGGNISNVPVEIEGKEVGETPNGSVFEAKGPSHEQGGIPISLPQATKMYSKRIKIDDVSMADRKKGRKKKEITLEKLLEKHNTDALIKNSLKRTKEVNKKEENIDLSIQGLIGKLMSNTNSNLVNTNEKQLQAGTDKYGIVDLYNTLKSSVNYNPILQEPNINPILNNQEESNSNSFVPQPFVLNREQMTKDYLKHMGERDKLTNNSFKNPFGNMTSGNMVGILGNLISTFGPKQNTMRNRAGDTPNINAYKNYGKKGLQTLDKSKEYIEQQRDENLKDLQLLTNTAIKRNRNSARGINTLRALDLASQQNANQQQSKIYNTFSQEMMNILNRQAQMENQQDQVVMRGEESRDLNDRKDRDNYYSQLAQDIASQGQGLQETGYDINKMKQANDITNLLKELSKYGLGFDKNLKLKKIK